MPSVKEILEWALRKPPQAKPSQSQASHILQLENENRDMRKLIKEFVFEETSLRVLLKDTTIQYSEWRKEVKEMRKKLKEVETAYDRDTGRLLERILKLRTSLKKLARRKLRRAGFKKKRKK